MVNFKNIFITLFLIIYINSYSQSESDNLKKYWYYRYRLKYFVYPGTERGESIMATMRNNWIDEN